MKAVVWHDVGDIRLDDVPDPAIEQPTDAVIRLTSSAICGSPIWTPLIPATMPPDKVSSFGTNTPLGRAGQPAELAPAYVLLASDEASYMTGALIPVTGGRPML